MEVVMGHECCNGKGPCIHNGNEGRKVTWSEKPVVRCHSPEKKCEFKKDWYHNWYCVCPIHEKRKKW